jgi:putative oxidoreductase
MLTAYPDGPVAAYGPSVLRLALAAVFIAHGGQKLGLWGGGSLEATAAYFAQLGIQPAMPAATIIGALELGGGLLLLFGAFTIFVGAALVLELLVGIAKVHLAGGFFLNWALVPGQAHGYEFDLVLIAGLACLMFSGPGAFSVDARRALHAESAAAGRARLRAGKV